MMKIPVPKLFQWLLKQFLLFSPLVFLLALLLYFLFFKSLSFFFFLLIFLFGFFFCSALFFFLFFRLLYPLSRLVKRVEGTLAGKHHLNQQEDLIFDSEPGEIYDLNKNLTQIHNYLRWQKRIISQESSELEAVISALTGGILAVDHKKKVLFFNNQATLLFSSQRRLQKKEIRLSEVIRNPDIIQVYDDCLQKGQVIKRILSVSAFETEDEPSFYEITVAPLKPNKQKHGKADRAEGAVGLFYDITNIRKTEKIQMDFISNVSHELRTPLTAIQGYVETLLGESEKAQPQQLESFLKIIYRNVKRLVSLLNHFLELSQMEEPLELKKNTINTKQITESIIKDLHIKNHKVKINCAQETVKADRHFLKQILYNLIDNVVKYVPKNTAVEVSWSKINDFVILKVKDEGPGISPRHKTRLFERFYRADPSRSSVKGVGIGLSIVKQLVEKHGGSIRVESIPQKGSVFICSFPD